MLRAQILAAAQTARGRVSTELNTLAQAFDLIVLGQRSGISVTAASPATSRFPRVHPHVGPVLVLFEAVSSFTLSLDLGARLARLNGAELVVLVGAEDEDAYRVACAVVQAALKERDLSGRCVWLYSLDDASLVNAARREAASCLVLANKERFLTQAGFDWMLDKIECPVVLTR